MTHFIFISISTAKNKDIKIGQIHEIISLPSIVHLKARIEVSVLFLLLLWLI